MALPALQKAALVDVHYARHYAAMMPHHGKRGRVRIVPTGRPRNYGVELDGGIIVIPRGNLRPVRTRSQLELFAERR